jgi:hypothetical protein
MKIPASPRELAGCYEVRQALGQSGKDIQPSSARWKPRPDLVNSISARAHLHHEQGSYNDPLNDREILRTTYHRRPDLTFEVRALGEKTRGANPHRIENPTR